MSILRKLVEFIKGSGSGNPKAPSVHSVGSIAKPKIIPTDGWYRYVGPGGWVLMTGGAYYIRVLAKHIRVYEQLPSEETLDNYKVELARSAELEMAKEWEFIKE